MNLYMEKPTKEYIALALDNVSEKQTLLELVSSTKEYIGIYKIGLEQFIRFGPEIVQLVKNEGIKLFLDLKLHDIPNTVAKAVTSASELGIDFLTIHTSGGLTMMQAAVKAARNTENPPKLIGVTVLTSIDLDTLNNELRIGGSVTDQVSHLAKLAVQAELDGIVCSAADLPPIKSSLPDGFEIITPGIRPAGSDVGDQKRVATPKQAVESGSTVLVIGRAITAAQDPVKAAREIVESIED